MADEKEKTPPPAPEWRHNQEISFKHFRGLCDVLKGRLEDALTEQRKELQRMIGVRDGLRK